MTREGTVPAGSRRHRPSPMLWASPTPTLLEMPSQPDHPHTARRVVLPSGKTVEVVFFEDQPGAAAAHGTSMVLPALHVCAACGSDLVHPVDWQEAGPSHWEVSLRCPNCETRSAGVYEQSVVERFDARLDDGTDALVHNLRQLVRANMEEEVTRFAAALQADFVRPEDF